MTSISIMYVLIKAWPDPPIEADGKLIQPVFDTPVGTMLQWVHTPKPDGKTADWSVPQGWLIADGRWLLRDTYVYLAPLFQPFLAWSKTSIVLWFNWHVMKRFRLPRCSPTFGYDPSEASGHQGTAQP